MITTRPTRASGTRGHVIEYVVAAAAFLGLAVPVALELRTPPTIAITFVNPHEWDVGVDVVLDDGARLGVATIEEDSTREVTELLHLENTLRLRWSFEGEEILVTTTSDDQLRAADHRITVPDEVAGRLRALGIPSSP